MGFFSDLNPFANTGINMKIRDTAETAVVVVGDYYLPGSSIITKNVASEGSQKQLNSDVGKVAQVVASGVGLGIGSSYTGIAPSHYGQIMQKGIDKGAGWIGRQGGKAVGLLVAGAKGMDVAPIDQSGAGHAPGAGLSAGDSGVNVQIDPTTGQPVGGASASKSPWLIVGAVALLVLKVIK